LLGTTSRILACALLLGMAQSAAADWQYYEAKSYGFSMLVPTGTTVKEKEWGGGWGQLWAEHEGVKLYGLAKLGAKESDQEIEKFAVRVIGIPANEWKLIDSGKGQGWERYRTFEAVRGDRLYFGGYGGDAGATTCSTWRRRSPNTTPTRPITASGTSPSDSTEGDGPCVRP
jgi:hypothetical protein